VRRRHRALILPTYRPASGGRAVSAWCVSCVRNSSKSPPAREGRVGSSWLIRAPSAFCLGPIRSAEAGASSASPARLRRLPERSEPPGVATAERKNVRTLVFIGQGSTGRIIAKLELPGYRIGINLPNRKQKHNTASLLLTDTAHITQWGSWTMLAIT